MNLFTAASLQRENGISFGRISQDSGPILAALVMRAVPAETNHHWPTDSARMKGDAISHALYGTCRNGHARRSPPCLLDRGADVNAKRVFGGTALHWAAINGHKETVVFLMALTVPISLSGIKSLIHPASICVTSAAGSSTHPLAFCPHHKDEKASCPDISSAFERNGAIADAARGNAGTLLFIGPSSLMIRFTIPRAGRPEKRFVTAV